MDLPPSAAPLRALGPDRLPPGVVDRLRNWPAGAAEVSAYLYDPKIAAARAVEVRRALPDWAELCYAVKANSFPPVLEALLRGTAATGQPAETPSTTGTGEADGLGGDGLAGMDGIDGFEVSSAREVSLALTAARRAAPGRPVRLVASGPGKSVSLLRALIGGGQDGREPGGVDVINAESPLELRRINEAAAAAGRRVAVGLRVNPARVGLSGSLQMGGRPSAFGIPEPDLPAAVALAQSLPWVDLVGFHIHAVSHNLDAAAHLAYVRRCLDFAVRIAREHRVDLRVLDVGGGFGVPFEPDRLGERPFDFGLFGAGLAELRPPEGLRMVFEPGRVLVADCGWYAAEVTDVKHAYGTDFVVLRGGIHHFQLPTSWKIVHNFAVVPREGWPAGLPRPGVTERPVTVVGELCTPEDTLARDITVDRVRAGDVVVFPMAGAYGYEFAMPEFLGHPRAPRLLVDSGSGPADAAGRQMISSSSPSPATA